MALTRTGISNQPRLTSKQVNLRQAFGVGEGIGEDNAFQERSPAALDAQEQTQDGEGVAEGNPKQESPKEKTNQNQN